MSDTVMIPAEAKSFSRKYLWPTPTGVICWISAMAVGKFLGQRAFLNTHVIFELSIIAALLASVVYSMRLSGKGRSLAPRWVFFLNLAFGPLILAFICAASILSLFSN